jgi:hypothetical protein
MPEEFLPVFLFLLKLLLKIRDTASSQYFRIIVLYVYNIYYHFLGGC